MVEKLNHLCLVLNRTFGEGLENLVPTKPIDRTERTTVSDLPAYVSVITVVGIAGILTSTCMALYLGSRTAGTRRSPAARTAAAAAILFGLWTTANALFAEHGGYHAQLGKQPPWLPLEAAAAIAALLVLARTQGVSRALSAPNAIRLLAWPHAFRVAGVALLISMSLGRLPALFAIPAGLGDVAVGIAEPFVTRRIKDLRSQRATKLWNLLGILDLGIAMLLGGLTGYEIVHVTPRNSALGELPLALIPTVGVPLLVTLHVLALRRIRVPQGAESEPSTVLSAATC